MSDKIVTTLAKYDSLRTLNALGGGLLIGEAIKHLRDGNYTAASVLGVASIPPLVVSVKVLLLNIKQNNERRAELERLTRQNQEFTEEARRKLILGSLTEAQRRVISD